MSKTITSGLYATIDIGNKSIKAVVIEVNNNNKRLLQTQSIELDPVDTITSEDAYKEQVKTAISKLAKQLDLSKCNKIISLFYNRDLQVKLLDLPSSVRQEQLQQVLPWEAKKLLSSHYKEEEFVYSYSITKENPISLILAVTPLSLLNAHLALYENTGIKPDSVYTNVFSSLALQSLIDIAGLPALSLVDFGYSGTHLNIYSAGKIKFYRYIPTGASELSNPPSDNELEMYSQKIRFSFDYFRAVSKLSQVDALFFMGGGSIIPNVISYEQNYFAPTKINPVDISSSIDISPVISSNMNETKENDKNLILLPFIPSIGACLADFRTDSDNMNLLTLIKKKENEKKLARLANLIPIVLGTIAFIIAAGIIYYQYNQENEKLQKLKEELNSVKTELTAYSEKVATIKEAEKSNKIKLSKESLKIVRPVINNKNSLRNLFQIIDKVKPDGIEIAEILVRNRQEADQISLKSKEELDAEKLEMQESSIQNSNNNSNNGNNEYDIFSEQNEQKQQKSSINPKFVRNIPLNYKSKLAEPLSESQIKEDFDGNIAIIHGFSNKSVDVSNFSDALTTNQQGKDNKTMPSALLRYISINLREADNNKVEFLLKGELK